MNKVFLIIKREYLTRVKKKSFIIMTILGPIMMAAMFIVPVYVAQLEGDAKNIGVIDQSGLFKNKFKNTDNISYSIFWREMRKQQRSCLAEGTFTHTVYPQNRNYVPNTAKLFSNPAAKHYCKRLYQ